MPLKITNNATGKLAAAINASVTTISIQAGEDVNFPVANQPGDWFPVTIVDASANREIMKCTQRVGTVMTVVRAQESTSAFSFSAGARVDVRLTAGALGEFMQKTDSNSMVGRLTLSGADDLGRIKFTGAQAPLFTGKPIGLEFLQSDLFFGVKPAGVESAGAVARWAWNDQADGLGVDVANLTKLGALSIAGGLTSGGAATFTGAVTAGGTVYSRAPSGNAHFWLQGPGGEDRGVIYTTSTSAGHLYIRNSAQHALTFATDGQFYGPSNLYASGARYQTDGNIVGAIWANLGYGDAYTAIVNRIENRANEYAIAHSNARFHASRMAGFVQYVIGAGTHLPSGYVCCGMHKGAAYDIMGRQPQLYSNNTGWVVAFPF